MPTAFIEVKFSYMIYLIKYRYYLSPTLRFTRGQFLLHWPTSWPSDYWLFLYIHLARSIRIEYRTVTVGVYLTCTVCCATLLLCISFWHMGLTACPQTVQMVNERLSKRPRASSVSLYQTFVSCVIYNHCFTTSTTIMDIENHIIGLVRTETYGPSTWGANWLMFEHAQVAESTDLFLDSPTVTTATLFIYILEVGYICASTLFILFWRKRPEILFYTLLKGFH